MLTQDRLKYLLDLDEGTGTFYWRNPASNSVAVGQRAGRVANNHYIGIMLDNKRHQAHRLVWLWYEGDFPDKQIDHINGERGDNRRSNLRLATRAENQQNIGAPRRHGSSGLLGVTKHLNRWRAQIKHEKVAYHIGVYDTPQEAHEAYLAAKSVLHAFQPTVRGADPILARDTVDEMVMERLRTKATVQELLLKAMEKRK